MTGASGSARSRHKGGGPAGGPAVSRGWVAKAGAGEQLHGSTLEVHGDRLFCAWFAGAWEGSDDTRVWLCARDVIGGPWSEAVLMSELTAAHWNPVLTVGPAGDLWLFYKVGPRISEWVTWYRRSSDGTTWSRPQVLVEGDAGGRGPVRNPPLLLPVGTWLAPASTEVWHPEPRWEPFVDSSTDGGATWIVRPIPVERERLRGAGLIQPALWRHRDRVVALMRSSEGCAYRSESTDGGTTWSTAEPVPLPNGNAALAAVPLDEHTVVCAYNPVSQDWGRRCPLVLSVSGDGGHTWRKAVVVEDGSTAPEGAPEPVPESAGPAGLSPADTGVLTDGTDEYSYPALLRCGNEVVVTYTWQRRAIAEARVPLAAVITQLRKEHA